jgi:hypothetical protein
MLQHRSGGDQSPDRREGLADPSGADYEVALMLALRAKLKR